MTHWDMDGENLERDKSDIVNRHISIPTTTQRRFHIVVHCNTLSIQFEGIALLFVYSTLRMVRSCFR